MAMFDRFSHYLGYGATDQQTIRALAGLFNGIVVPGTIAAFQREGTGGFVLTLSATHAAPPYVIDSRFPLFQQPLPTPKQSHIALASLLGAPELVSSAQPQFDLFTDEFVSNLSRNWVEFNVGYQELAGGKFDKYAKRLREDVVPPQAQSPEYILPLYAIAGGLDDPWWDVSRRLFDAAVRLGSTGPQLSRVVAATSTMAIGELLTSVPGEEEIAVWVSGMDELQTSSYDLATFARASRASRDRGQRLFDLYGGFFSVLMAGFGLCGSAHGIGFGESRKWLELPTSGPPPARFYLPRAHRYVRQDLAQDLWTRCRALAECSCPECGDTPPIALEYHSLMKHSVHCRALEIEKYGQRDPDESRDVISQDLVDFTDFVRDDDTPGYLSRQVDKATEHLGRWIEALELAQRDI